MSKYAGFAKRLDEAFRAARDEYKSAHDKLKEAEKNRSNGNPGSAQRQRAELDYQDAKTEFRDAERRIWGEFTRTRADLRRELAERVAADSSANPDTVDVNGLELLKSGILAKYARDAASDPSNDQATRGALYMLSERCTRRRAVGHITPEGGDAMRITLHIGRFTVTIIVKSRNRHSAK